MRGSREEGEAPFSGAMFCLLTTQRPLQEGGRKAWRDLGLHNFERHRSNGGNRLAFVSAEVADHHLERRKVFFLAFPSSRELVQTGPFPRGWGRTLRGRGR